ncbi:MAG: HNH endonuclease [Propionibacteriaceae bacterium]|nr:HNH endonuclease [Propionibacteriaceae bacterium]
MRYWWASQGKNYKHVAQVGDLWTCPASGGRRRVDRELILEIRAGDLVFHYGDEYLRAISEADSSWRPLARPLYYPRLPGEGDDGWQVQTTPVITDLRIHFSEVASVVSHGSPGPLDRTGRPMQKFLSVLEAMDAGALLSLIGANLGEAASAEGGSQRVWGGEATSAIREALARREQAALREYLLAGEAEAECALCGRRLPAEFLVAAHIHPRHLLDEDSRRRFGEIAMLACRLGCDSLFEAGYLTVDRSGVVQSSGEAVVGDLRVAVEAVVGRRCRAHSGRRAPAFARHAARFATRDPA